MLFRSLPKAAGVADKDKVAAARAAYDALTADQKKLVNGDTLNKLTEAEGQVKAAEEAAAAEQKAAEEKAAADQAAAQAVIDAINALPANAGVADKNAVAAARAAYDALTDAQTALIGGDVAGRLTTAESQMAAASEPAPLPPTYEDDTGKYTINAAELTATYWKPLKKVSKVKSAKIPDEIVVQGVTLKVTAIGDKAFYKAKKMTKVTIGKNVQTIGKSAFASCVKLKTVSGGSGVVTIGASAFKGDKVLAKITLGTQLTTIGKSAFNGCKKLKTVTIKSSKLKKVGSSAFKGVSSSVTFKCPSKKLKAYKKLIKKAGAPSKAKYKK